LTQRGTDIERVESAGPRSAVPPDVSLPDMSAPTRWVTDTEDGHSQRYIERFRSMAADGVDLGGEARLLDAMLPPGSHILDAGCGPGRVGAVLHDRGHRVVGVDADPDLIAAAREDHRGPQWIVADLADLDLAAVGIGERFDAAVVAGNVMAFLAPGTEPEVLRRIAAHLVPGGFAVVGFGTTRGYALEAFDEDLRIAGFVLEHRFVTWDLRPWHSEADFAVSVLRLPTPGGPAPPGPTSLRLGASDD
jgi:SAM-dependent methyltransferase